MREQVSSIMLALLKNVICGTTLSEKLIDDLKPEMMPKLYALSKAHDMVHIVARGLQELHLLDGGEIASKFQKQQMVAVYRYQKLNYSLGEICNVLEAAKIPFLPLKGAIVRRYYPEPWMRTSCDIDILVHEEDLECAMEVLVEKLNYTTDKKRNYHDVSLYAPNGIHLELHFNIKEDTDYLDGMLEKVWEYAVPVANTACQYTQTNEYLLFHHIAHMSYHFVHGGCGVKPFLDLHLLKKNLAFEDRTVRELCRACKIERFYESVLALTDVWFGDGTHTEITYQMQAYILDGGVYGTLENRVAVQQGKKGGKFFFILSRLFVPYDLLKRQYPVLERHKCLLPIMEVRRWFRTIFGGRMKTSLRELNASQSISKEKSAATQAFLRNLGL